MNPDYRHPDLSRPFPGHRIFFDTSGQISLRQRRSHPGCENFAFGLVVMLKAIGFFEGRDAYNLALLEADHARPHDLFWLESRPA